MVDKKEIEQQKIQDGLKLMKFCSEGNLPEVKKMIDSGTPANFINRDEGTWGAYTQEGAIHCALDNYGQNASKGIFDLGLLEYLLQNGADINAESASYNWKGTGSTRTAFSTSLSIIFHYSDENLLRLILKYGGDPNIPIRNSGHSMRTDSTEVSYPIIKAVNSNKADLVRIFIEGKADVNKARHYDMYNEYGSRQNLRESALVVACRNCTGETDIIELLLEANADVNSVAYYLKEEYDETKQLGSDPREDDFVTGYTHEKISECPLDIAIQKRNKKLIFLLSVYGAKDFSYKVMNENRNIEFQLNKYFDGEEINEVKNLVKTKWNKDVHKYLPKKLRRNIESIFLAMKLKGKIKLDIIKLVLDNVLDLWKTSRNLKHK